MSISIDIPAKTLLMFAENSGIFKLFGKQKHNIPHCAIQKFEAMKQVQMNLLQPFSKPLHCIIRETLMNTDFE